MDQEVKIVLRTIPGVEDIDTRQVWVAIFEDGTEQILTYA